MTHVEEDAPEAEARGELPPGSVEEALSRARAHGGAALAEATAALRCLIDAASLAASGTPAEAHAGLRRAAGWLERAEAAARAGAAREPQRWLENVADALDAEIARWESRSREDPEARAVLRAFLSVREMLWEVGLRPARRGRGDGATGTTDASAGPRRPPLRRARGARVERVPIQS